MDYTFLNNNRKPGHAQSTTTSRRMSKVTQPRHIVFFHPDLGIGGAERLVVDAAVGLQNLGHQITIFTSHCDPAHCFEEARDGTLNVRVRGNTLIPPSVFGRFSILCAILRQIHLFFQIAVFGSELQQLQPDAFFVDQLSACVPLLRLWLPKAKTLFYCHFPDKLLAKRGAFIKDLYRIPFDWFEGWTTGVSDVIVVNSAFTRSVFDKAFPGLRGRRPAVVYPCVDTQQDAAPRGGERPIWKDKKVILSINRFERKKDIELAIKAFSGLASHERQNVRLVIAGGYDPRVTENVAYHKELVSLSEQAHLKHATASNLVTAMSIPTDIEVLFLLSVPSSLKATLLGEASLVVYTPGMEHFGIVPLEAMLARVPVLAANTGGPTETVVDEETGWLRSVQQPDDWSDVMRRVLHETSAQELHAMGEKGRARVVDLFSKTAMAQRLDEEISTMLASKVRPGLLSSTFVTLLLTLGIGVLLGAMAARSQGPK